MKVALITRHAISNYGSLLQAMATQFIIKKMGHSCEIINYIRDDEAYWREEQTLLKKKPEWNHNILKKAFYLTMRQPEGILSGRRFECAQKKYLNLTRRYHSVEELAQDKPKADVYLTGSDQVWGPVADGSYDSSYCLSFTSEQDKKIAYAASFGHTDMTPERMAYFERWLKRYTHISVREDSAVSILDKMGIHATQVIDPTLLLGSDYWTQFTRPISKKYVLVYQLHNDKRLGRYAEKVARKLQLPLIRVSASLHQISRPGKLIWCPEIGDFLSYIKYATCLITDSFHGTAFAINFNTPFVEVLPNNNTGTRNMSILRLTGFSDRILKDENDVALAGKEMNFDRANQILQQQREFSLQVLQKMIVE